MDEILDALARELALADIGTLTTIVVRVVVAALLGGVIGWEREQKGRAAGLKTHILVSVGSALFVLAPSLGGVGDGDNTRVMQGIVSGIGFLGAGAILRRDGGTRVEGLTTAASIWMTAAIGMAAGIGQEIVALATTLVARVVVGALPRVVGRTPAHQGLGRGGDGGDGR
ncbi:MAG: MgtC/SapB family protein [Lysobacteraceae bacterium]|nr:MAG: MgtC/SapB family protein [Xanthomonadaceae bacterium]